MLYQCGLRDVDHSLHVATRVLVQAPTCSYVSLLIGFPTTARGLLSKCMSDHFSPLLRIFLTTSRVTPFHAEKVQLKGLSKLTGHASQ